MPKKLEFDKVITDSMKLTASGSFADNIKMIDVDELHESGSNFFDMSRIEELAETIYEQGGVMENLIVTPREEGGYEIISGHRRTAAVRELLRQDKRVGRVLPCLVRNYADEDEKQIEIILMNVSARILTNAEMWKSYEITNEILKQKKKLGEKFGQVQYKLAELLGVSTGQVAKMQNIDRKATPEVKAALESGDISIHTADKIAKLADEEQKRVLETNPQVKPKDIEKSITNDSFSDDYEGDDSADDVSVESGEDGDDDSDEPEHYEVEEPPPKPEKPPPDNLNDYVLENSGVLCAIFDTYLGITDSEDERAVIAGVKRFMESGGR
jgi:ParB-like chromosome segregation protein Spo0J